MTLAIPSAALSLFRNEAEAVRFLQESLLELARSAAKEIERQEGVPEPVAAASLLSAIEQAASGGVARILREVMEQHGAEAMWDVAAQLAGSVPKSVASDVRYLASSEPYSLASLLEAVGLPHKYREFMDTAFANWSKARLFTPVLRSVQNLVLQGEIDELYAANTVERIFDVIGSDEYTVQDAKAVKWEIQAELTGDNGLDLVRGVFFYHGFKDPESGEIRQVTLVVGPEAVEPPDWAIHVGAGGSPIKPEDMAALLEEVIYALRRVGEVEEVELS